MDTVLIHFQEWLLVHRAHLHTALREKASGKEGKGKPCQLKLASKVVSVDPELAEVTLENGEKLRGDLLLGADGVHVSLPIFHREAVRPVLMPKTVQMSRVCQGRRGQKAI